MPSVKYCLLVLLITVCFLAAAQERFALVIGVQDYSAVSPLRNSLRDAQDISASLKRKGFTVTEVYNPQSKREIHQAVLRHFDGIRGNEGAEGLFYYSGHAVQVDGSNYLMPASANPQLKADLEEQCVRMDYILSAFEEAGNKLNIIIMDACRNNPFRGFSRGTERGLNQVLAPRGSYVVYATSPGNVASDGEGSNGLFTSKFLKYMEEPALNFEQMFKRVANEVEMESGKRQTPWISSSYTGDFYFNSTEGTPAIVAVQGNQIHQVPKSNTGSRGIFETAKIGAQEWMKENLNVRHYRNGDEIPQVQDAREWSGLTTGAWCYYQDKSGVVSEKVVLYNWYAVNDPRGLAPEGWRIPSDADWSGLEKAIGSDAAKSLKSVSGWHNNMNGSNSSGFNAVAVGLRYSTGIFSLSGMSGYWWSSGSNSNVSANSRLLSFSRTGLAEAILPKASGLAVRCVKP